MVTTNYRDILKERLEQRRLRNPRYSQAAFARDLSLSSGRLNEIIRGKQGMSPAVAEKIAVRLQLKQKEKNIFCDLVRASHSRDALEKENARMRVERAVSDERYRVLSLDSFRVISDWWHFAILELMKTQDFKSSPSWIAKRLEVPETEIIEAVLRLKRLKFITINGPRWALKEENLHFPGGIPAGAGKRFHQQVLKKAFGAIMKQNLEQREISTTLFAIAPRRLPYLKKKMEEFWKQMDLEMSQDEDRSDVYCLGMQLFNLSTGGKHE